jgi:catechol-2,3-dioxygenase
MRTEGFDHYNLRAPRALLDELCTFYSEVVGLTVGDRPPFRRFGYWLYAGAHPVLHLGEADEGESCPTNVAATFNHASFRCTGQADFERLLSRRNIPYRVAHVPQTQQAQLFFKDPAGNGVELIFAADSAQA